VTGVAPGWYPDPAAPETQRYWDGEQWVGEPIPSGTQAPSAPAPEKPPAPSIPPGTLPQFPRLPASFPSAAAPAQAPPVGYQQPAPQLPTDVHLAPVGARFLARVVDAMALFVLNLVVNGYFLYQFQRETAPVVDAWAKAFVAGDQLPPLEFSERAQTLRLLFVIVSVGLWFAYEVPATAGSGQTLGKRLLGIKVARIDAQQITFWQSTRRWFIIGLPPSLLGICALPLSVIDALWCTWDRPAQQCLHDKAVQTVVVLAPPKSAPNDRREP
jgi:uncharacterized RDD family membrane protein YckC